MSSGSAQRPSGVLATIASLRAGSSCSGCVQRRTHPSGRDCVDANPIARVRQRERLRKLRHAPLARAVRRYPRTSLERQHRSHVHDRSALAAGPRLQLAAREGATAHRAGQVDGKHVLEHREFVLGIAADDAGAIHQHVEARQIREQRLHRPRVANVERDGIPRGEIRRAARNLDLLLRCTRYGDNRACLRQRAGDRSADAARAPCDECYLARKQIVAERRFDAARHLKPRRSAVARHRVREASGATAPYPVVASAAAALA